MRSFATNEVHTIKPGSSRADADGAPVTDIITEGMRQLVHRPDGPIAKFNKAFARLQKRRRVKPVSAQWEELESGLNQNPTGTNKGGKSDDEDEGEGEKATKCEVDHGDSESDIVEQVTESGSESGANESDEYESDESEGGEFWEKAFDLEFELGEEVFNVFGDVK